MSHAALANSEMAGHVCVRACVCVSVCAPMACTQALLCHLRGMTCSLPEGKQTRGQLFPKVCKAAEHCAPRLLNADRQTLSIQGVQAAARPARSYTSTCKPCPASRCRSCWSTSWCPQSSPPVLPLPEGALTFLPIRWVP